MTRSLEIVSLCIIVLCFSDHREDDGRESIYSSFRGLYTLVRQIKCRGLVLTLRPAAIRWPLPTLPRPLLAISLSNCCGV